MLVDSNLVGGKLEAIALSPDSYELMIKANGLWHRFEAYGDCCSVTWIENVEAKGLVGGSITGISEEPLPHQLELPTTYGDHDQVQYYGLTFNTTKGDIAIDFRNDSNGYYGGSLEYRGQSGGPGQDWRVWTE